MFAFATCSGLVHLRVLNAAHNKVSDLSKLDGCIKLEKLELQDNEVMSLDSLPTNLHALRQLTLREGDATNPVYEDPSFESVDEAESVLLEVLQQRCPNVFLFNGAHTVRSFMRASAKLTCSFGFVCSDLFFFACGQTLDLDMEDFCKVGGGSFT